MRPISHEGIVVPLDHPNVDTDQILPKQFLKINRITGFGEHLFADWRYTEDESGRVTENPGFALNEDRYRGASILLTRDNFGCGSSREHAVWALCQYGFRSIIAPSFADIFYANARNNGLVLVILSKQQIDDLFAYVKVTQGAILRVDLEQREVRIPSGSCLPFLNPVRYSGDTEGGDKEGLDTIARTLRYETDIVAFETRSASG